MAGVFQTSHRPARISRPATVATPSPLMQISSMLEFLRRFQVRSPGLTTLMVTSVPGARPRPGARAFECTMREARRPLSGGRVDQAGDFQVDRLLGDHDGRPLVLFAGAAPLTSMNMLVSSCRRRSRRLSH